MFRSIRSLFLGWHTGILVVVLVGFGATLFHLQRQAVFKEVDTELAAMAEVLVATLRHGPQRPPWRWEGLPGPDVMLQEQFKPKTERWRNAQERVSADVRRFAQLDSDADGQLSAEEVMLAYEQWLDQYWEALQGQFDLDDDGLLSVDEFTSLRRAEGPEPPAFQIPSTLLRRGRRGTSGVPYFVIWHLDGTVFEASRLPVDLSVPPAPRAKRAPSSYLRQRDIWREIVVAGPLGMVVLVGKSMQKDYERLAHLLWRLVGTGCGVLAVGLVGGWVLAQRVTKPLATISATAAAISASDLSRRIDVTTTKSELGQLAQVLNTMFARLEAAFAQQTRFTADASHELRTPVSIILTQTELALAKERPAAEYHDALEACCRAAKRMKSLVESLLTLAQIDAGTLPLRPQPFDLRQSIEECVALLTPLAAERHIILTVDGPSVVWEGDADRMAQVITNLMTNAIHYNRDGGRVQVTLTPSPTASEVVLTVADTGVGMASDDLAHIFERFYRIDKARSRALGGSGLGLPICQHIIAAHGGMITCHSEVDTGTTFVVRLPLTSPGA
jgi:heavy metal sensor kinase